MATLQDAVVVNRMHLRNRIAMPPLTANYATPRGIISEDILEFYSQRSKDVGLVIVVRLLPGTFLIPQALLVATDIKTAALNAPNQTQ